MAGKVLVNLTTGMEDGEKVTVARESAAFKGSACTGTITAFICKDDSCKGPLKLSRAANVLVCRAERLAFPIKEGVPMMLEEDARQLASDDPLLAR